MLYLVIAVMKQVLNQFELVTASHVTTLTLSKFDPKLSSFQLSCYKNWNAKLAIPTNQVY
jgi:hypothetical protein